MVIVAVVNVGAVYYFIGQTDTVSNSVNTAGQQRMLSQQMARYAALTDSGDDIQANRDKLRSAMEKFDSNLQTLENGGTANGATLKPAPGAVQTELAAEKQAWNEYRSHVETVLNADPNSGEFQRSLEYVDTNTNELMGQADDLTSAFAQVSNSEMGFLKQLLIGLLVLNIAVFVVGIFVSRRIFATPIQELASAANALAAGQFDDESLNRLERSETDATDTEQRNDEIATIQATFGAMQSNLRSVFDEIDTFSDNLASGDEDLRARQRNTDFPGTYGDIMTNLDRGATQMVGSFEEIRTASSDLQQGRLDQDIDTDRPGNYGDILTGFDDGMTALSDSFDEIAGASKGLKDGDLDQRLDTDYPGRYGRALTDLDAGIEQLSQSIESVQSIATEVAASSEEVSASAEEIEAASEEVASSVEEISHGAELQSENLQEVASEMNDMSATVEEIASSSEEVAATATTAVEHGENGREHAAEASEEIDAIEATADQATTQVRALDDKMEEIGEIVDMITGIAEQTNMLALNASIEAARAGEAGEGFGVVANEIKGLAEEAAQATTKIETRIDEVQSTTDETVTEMQEMRDRVDSGAETIENAIEMFDDIADAVQEAEGGIREISDATDDQAASSEEVVSMVDEVSTVSQQTSDEASNVSAATEEQASSLSEASQTLQQLSRFADDLHDEVSSFDVQGGAGTRTSGPKVIEPGSELSAPTAVDGGRNQKSERPFQGRDS